MSPRAPRRPERLPARGKAGICERRRGGRQFAIPLSPFPERARVGRRPPRHVAPRRMRVHGTRPPVIRCTSDLEYPGRGRTRHAGGIAVRGAPREAFVTGRTWLRRTASRRGRFAARRVVRARGAPRRARAGFSRRRAPRATRRASARGRRRPRACRSRRSRRWRTSDEPLGSATCEPESWLPPSARRRGCPSPRHRCARYQDRR